MGYFRENIEKLEGYTPGFQPKGEDILKLNTNENPYSPSPLAMKAIGNIKAENLRKYPQPQGDDFCKAAAEFHCVKPENIICTNGGDDLLTIAFRSFCDENRKAAFPVPTYSLYSVLADIQNCPKEEIPYDKEFNLPAKLANSGAALTIVCNPNAPSGTFVPVEEVASLADELEGVLLIDEAYVDFAEDNCLRLIEEFNNLIILRSMSKGYSLAGLRFGYGIASKNLIQGMMKVKDSYNVDALATVAATAAIKDQEYFKGNVEKIKAERDKLADALKEKGFKVGKSFTNFLLARKDNAKEIYRKLADKNIFVRYFDHEGLRDKIRITVGTEEQNKRLIETLEQIM